MNYLKEELYGLIKKDDRIFDFLQESALDGMWYWDLENMSEEWMNERFWVTLGYDPAEMPHRADAWQNIINQDDLKATIGTLERHLADPAVPYDQVVRYRHKRGHIVYIRCRGMAIRDENGKPRRMLGAHIDVTEEKEKEVALRQTQKVARIGIWRINVLEHTVEIDSIIRAIHEVGPDFIPTVENGFDFYKPGSSRQTIEKLVRAAVEEGEPFDTELQLITARGREIWVNVIGQPELHEGQCVRIHGTCQDIDARRRNEERMLSYSILEAMSKEMEQFAYVASHDLREPLLTIQGYLDVVREDFGHQLPQEALGHLNTITAATQRMDTLIRGLLDYTRLSKVKQLQEVDLQRITDDVLSDLNSATAGIDVHYVFSELPHIVGYPLELKVLLQNLISNAIKYRKVDRPCRIEVTCEDTPSGWHIRVTDNGIGIARKDLNDIFQLFRQLHHKGTFAGSGIGLASCKRIVELHAGEIWAESTVGEGSVFHFTVNTRALGEAPGATTAPRKIVDSRGG